MSNLSHYPELEYLSACNLPRLKRAMELQLAYEDGSEPSPGPGHRPGKPVSPGVAALILCGFDREQQYFRHWRESMGRYARQDTLNFIIESIRWQEEQAEYEGESE